MDPVVHADAAAAKRLAELALTAPDLISPLAFDFSDLYPAEARWPSADEGDLATWLLLYHVAPERIRAELSLAHGIDRRGHVSQRIERIILPGLRTDV